MCAAARNGQRQSANQFKQSQTKDEKKQLKRNEQAVTTAFTTGQRKHRKPQTPTTIMSENRFRFKTPGGDGGEGWESDRMKWDQAT